MVNKQTALASISALVAVFALVLFQVISLPVGAVLAAGNPISNPVSIPVSNPISNPVITPTESTLTNGLLAFWKMDEASTSGQISTVTDYANNIFTGTAVNTVTSVAGTVNKAAHLNGTNSYITTSKSSALSPAAISVSTWVKINAYTGSYPRIVSKNGVYELIMYTYAGGEGRLEWDIRNPNENDTVTSASNKLQLGRWYNLVTEYDGTASRIYINGVKVAEKAGLSGNLVTSISHPVTLGAQDTSGRNAAIDIDETRVYNRALTNAEITTLATH